jgi:hypothetical protein
MDISGIGRETGLEPATSSLGTAHGGLRHNPGPAKSMPLVPDAVDADSSVHVESTAYKGTFEGK